MRPTTSTTTSTNNSKNISRQISQIFWKLRSVSTPIFSRFNSTIWRIFCGSSFRFLTHSRYNFKWDCERRVKFGLRYPCFGENYFVIYREGKNWLAIVILHHGYGWSSRIYVKLWQVGPVIPIYEISRNYENGRREAGGGSSYRKRKYEFTRRKLRNHETPPLLIEKSHVTRYHERRGQ